MFKRLNFVRDFVRDPTLYEEPSSFHKIVRDRNPWGGLVPYKNGISDFPTSSFSSFYGLKINSPSPGGSSWTSIWGEIQSTSLVAGQYRHRFSPSLLRLSFRIDMPDSGDVFYNWRKFLIQTKLPDSFYGTYTSANCIRFGFGFNNSCFFTDNSEQILSFDDVEGGNIYVPYYKNISVAKNNASWGYYDTITFDANLGIFSNNYVNDTSIPYWEHGRKKYLVFDIVFRYISFDYTSNSPLADSSYLKNYTPRIPVALYYDDLNYTTKSYTLPSNQSKSITLDNSTQIFENFEDTFTLPNFSGINPFTKITGGYLQFLYSGKSNSTFAGAYDRETILYNASDICELTGSGIGDVRLYGQGKYSTSGEVLSGYYDINNTLNPRLVTIPFYFYDSTQYGLTSASYDIYYHYISGMNLVLKGVPSGNIINPSIHLGYEPLVEIKTADLFISGNYAKTSGNFNLYTSGYNVYNSGINFISSGTTSGLPNNNLSLIQTDQNTTTKELFVNRYSEVNSYYTSLLRNLSVGNNTFLSGVSTIEQDSFNYANNEILGNSFDSIYYPSLKKQYQNSLYLKNTNDVHPGFAGIYINLDYSGNKNLIYFSFSVNLDNGEECTVYENDGVDKNRINVTRINTNLYKLSVIKDNEIVAEINSLTEIFEVLIHYNPDSFQTSFFLGNSNNKLSFFGYVSENYIENMGFLVNYSSSPNIVSFHSILVSDSYYSGDINPGDDLEREIIDEHTVFKFRERLFFDNDIKFYLNTSEHFPDTILNKGISTDFNPEFSKKERLIPYAVQPTNEGFVFEGSNLSKDSIEISFNIDGSLRSGNVLISGYYGLGQEYPIGQSISGGVFTSSNGNAFLSGSTITSGSLGWEYRPNIFIAEFADYINLDSARNIKIKPYYVSGGIYNNNNSGIFKIGVFADQGKVDEYIEIEDIKVRLMGTQYTLPIVTTQNFNLHTINTVSENSGVNLYTSGEYKSFGNTNLITEGATKFEGFLNLILEADQVDFNTINLNTSGQIGFHSGLNLCTSGAYKDQNYLNLFIQNFSTAQNDNLNLLMYNSGVQNENISLNLFLLEGSGIGNLNLFMNGLSSESSILDLHTISLGYESTILNLMTQNTAESFDLNLHTLSTSLDTNSLDLVTVNAATDTRALALHTLGKIKELTTMNLFVDSDVNLDFKPLNLYIDSGFNTDNGSVNSKTIDFIINGDDKAGSINMFIAGFASGIETQGMNFFTKGETIFDKSFSSTDLIVFNNASGDSRRVNLFVRSADKNLDSMNLYIEKLDGVYNTLGLVLGTDKFEQSSVTLFQSGMNLDLKSLNLYISGQGNENKVLPLYNVGF